MSHLEHALSTNRDIGAAIGVLMASHKITKDEAFDLLRIASQHGHRKLYEVAREVIESGALDYPASVLRPAFSGTTDSGTADSGTADSGTADSGPVDPVTLTPSRLTPR
ncbi:MAG: ANTAR domain-containing protein [Jatrophihabitantaceae bacterium]